jgi:hypothetical protein
MISADLESPRQANGLVVCITQDANQRRLQQQDRLHLMNIRVTDCMMKPSEDCENVIEHVEKL